ncbi:MAG: nitroreductase family deazaflavin-dependent oxidoreductase [Actinomycetota bacterium]|nr:nitroreductase family deazaflavin-dependent oxidoreductase [Actinomycetota bacterium]
MAGSAQRLIQRISQTSLGYRFVSTVPPKLDPAILRLTGGRFSFGYPLPVMLLTTTGAKSGLERSSPLVYIDDGDSLILIASNFGRPGHPAWYHNLKANPTATVLAGKLSGTYTATEVTDPQERDRAWRKAVEIYPGYDDYVARAEGRTIPVVRLETTERPSSA